ELVRSTSSLLVRVTRTRSVFMRIAGLCFLLAIFWVSVVHAQGQVVHSSSMDMSGMSPDKMAMESHTLAETILQHTTSGTDAQPNSTPTEMLMTRRGSWTLMFHGEVFLNELQQSGPRGANKFFSTNWFMPMAQRKLGRGTLTLRTMFSLEPGTVTGERYPELFQQGETAYGKPIVDGQHPHDFLMEVAAIYDYRVSEHTLLSVYAAPIC